MLIIVKTLGEWDLEIEVEVNDDQVFRNIEMEIREKYAKCIQNISSIPLYEPIKLNFFPKFLVQKDKNV